MCICLYIPSVINFFLILVTIITLFTYYQFKEKQNIHSISSTGIWSTTPQCPIIILFSRSSKLKAAQARQNSFSDSDNSTTDTESSSEEEGYVDLKTLAAQSDLPTEFWWVWTHWRAFGYRKEEGGGHIGAKLDFLCMCFKYFKDCIFRF